jgi:alkylation response protein AidB-like acyl-CoA dehydrogenase
MDLSLSPEHEAFRAEVRAFLLRSWDPKDKKDPEAVKRFRQLATDHGYLYRGIARRYGGSEQPADPIRANVVREAFANARAPGELNTPSVKMLVPTLLERGTEDQKTRFVAKSLSGEFNWCQGYSEPGSGSDLASLKSRATKEGDEWIINAHKIWTSRARQAQFMFMLVRTEPDKPKHDGLSYLLVDLRQPGVTIRPLKDVTGASHFNEVFLDDVRTPADWIVGERGQGWSVSHTTLKHERNSIGSASASGELFDKLVALARTRRSYNRPMIADESIRQRLAALEGVVMAQKYMAYHQLSMAAESRETSRANMINKLLATDIGHEVARIAQTLIGEEALSMPTGARTGPYADAKWVNQVLGSLGVSIAGGASNIQRNIIAERGLGLPRDAA